MKKFDRCGNLLTIAMLAFGIAFFCAQRQANAGGVSLNIESGHTTLSLGVGHGGAGFYIGSTKNVVPAPAPVYAAPAVVVERPTPPPAAFGVAPGGPAPIVRGQAPAPRPDRRPDPRGGMTAPAPRVPGGPRAMTSQPFPGAPREFAPNRPGAPRPVPGGAYRPR